MMAMDEMEDFLPDALILMKANEDREVRSRRNPEKSTIAPSFAIDCGVITDRRREGRREILAGLSQAEPLLRSGAGCAHFR